MLSTLICWWPLFTRLRNSIERVLIIVCIFTFDKFFMPDNNKNYWYYQNKINTVRFPIIFAKDCARLIMNMQFQNILARYFHNFHEDDNFSRNRSNFMWIMLMNLCNTSCLRVFRRKFRRYRKSASTLTVPSILTNVAQ